MFFKKKKASERGVVGIVLSEEDEPYVEAVFSHLSRALYAVPDVEVDLLLIFRPQDKKVQYAAQISRPPRIAKRFALEVHYQEELILGEMRIPPEIIAQEKNAMREFTLNGDYDWLFLLDMAVYLKEDTLAILINSKKDVVGVPYRGQEYPHPWVVASKDRFNRVVFNPHLVKNPKSLLPCVALDFGATLIRRSALYQEFTLENYFGVISCAFGFFKSRYEQGILSYFPSNYLLDNVKPPYRESFIPYFDSAKPVYIALNQLAELSRCYH